MVVVEMQVCGGKRCVYNVERKFYIEENILGGRNKI